MRFYSFCFAAVLLFGVSSALAQQPKWSWAKDIGSNRSSDRSIMTQVDTKGDIIVAGVEAIQDQSEYFTISKFSPNGNLKWIKQITYIGAMLPAGLCIDSNDNIYMLMNLRLADTAIWFESLPIPLKVWESPIIKINSDGEYRWHKIIRGENPNWASEANFSLLAIDRDNNLCFAGGRPVADSTVSIDGIPYLHFYGDRFFAGKISTEGIVLWVKLIDENPDMYDGISRPNYIISDAHNDIIIGGVMAGNFINSEYVYTVKNKLGIFLCKLSEGGSFKWLKLISGTGNAIPWGLTVDNENFYYILADASNPITISGVTDPIINPSPSNILLAKFDENGKYIWSKFTGGLGKNRGGTITDCPLNMAYSPKSHSLICKSHIYNTAKIDSMEFIASEKNGTNILWSYSTEGIFNWAFPVNSDPGYLQFDGITIDKENNAYLCGFGGQPLPSDTLQHEFAIGPNKFTSLAGMDAVFAKLSLDGSAAVKTNRGTTTQLLAYPNPFSESTTIDLPMNSSKAITVELINILGVNVYTTSITDQSKMLIDRNGLPAGMYECRVRYADGAQVSIKLVLE